MRLPRLLPRTLTGDCPSSASNCVSCIWLCQPSSRTYGVVAVKAESRGGIKGPEYLEPGYLELFFPVSARVRLTAGSRAQFAESQPDRDMLSIVAEKTWNDRVHISKIELAVGLADGNETPELGYLEYVVSSRSSKGDDRVWSSTEPEGELHRDFAPMNGNGTQPLRGPGPCTSSKQRAHSGLQR
jgi:hypothetical protein